MKTLRRILICLGAVAIILLGLTQLGGTPIYKGYNTGLDFTMEKTPDPRLALSTDTGDLTCWVKLRLPANSQQFSASLSTGDALSVYEDSVHGGDQWIAIVAEGQKREAKFKWPSGTTIRVVSKTGGSLIPSDWRVYLSDQGFDSKDRALWRRIAFRFSVFLLVLALVGGGLEAYAKIKDESIPFTHERCLSELIKSIVGANDRETKWMQLILTKVLLEGVQVADVLESLPLKGFQKRVLWFKTRNQLRSRIEWIIAELNKDLIELQP